MATKRRSYPSSIALRDHGRRACASRPRCLTVDAEYMEVCRPVRKGNKNALKHGHYKVEVVAERRYIQELIKQRSESAKEIK